MLDRLAYFGDRSFTVAPRIGELYQPLFARYEPESALAAVDLALAERAYSLLGVLERLGSSLIELPLLEGDAELLLDWDTPGDVRRSRPHTPDHELESARRRAVSTVDAEKRPYRRAARADAPRLHDEKATAPRPSHFRHMPEPGACRKPLVVPQSHRSQPTSGGPQCTTNPEAVWARRSIEW